MTLAKTDLDVARLYVDTWCPRNCHYLFDQDRRGAEITVTEI